MIAEQGQKPAGLRPPAPAPYVQRALDGTPERAARAPDDKPALTASGRLRDWAGALRRRAVRLRVCFRVVSVCLFSGVARCVDPERSQHCARGVFARLCAGTSSSNGRRDRAPPGRLRPGRSRRARGRRSFPSPVLSSRSWLQRARLPASQARPPRRWGSCGVLLGRCLPHQLGPSRRHPGRPCRPVLSLRVLTVRACGPGAGERGAECGAELSEGLPAAPPSCPLGFPRSPANVVSHASSGLPRSAVYAQL